jgi:hypothetical protein
VKEHEQQLQSLEAQRRALDHHRQHHRAKPDATPSITSAVESAATSNCSSSVTEDARSDAPPFARFFAYPQYVWCHHPPRNSTTTTMLPAEDGGGRPGVADVEVSLVETHASVRVMAPRRPGQLLKMVTGLQLLRLAVLHLTVTALDNLALYSLSVKVRRTISSSSYCSPVSHSFLRSSFLVLDGQKIRREHIQTPRLITYLQYIAR